MSIEIDAGRLLHLKFDVGLHHGLEARGRQPSPDKFPAPDSGSCKPRVLVTVDRADVRRGVGNCDGRIWHDRAAGVFHLTRDLPEV